MNGIMRTIGSALLSAIVLLLSAKLPAEVADAQVTENDAAAEAIATSDAQNVPVVTNVTDTLIIRENTAIAENETLYVRDGGSVYVMDDVTLTVKGALKCAAGGAIYARGTISTEGGSTMSITGKIKILSMGGIDLGGKLSVNNGGIIKGLGSLNVLNDFSNINCIGTVEAKVKAPEPVTKDGVTTVGGIIVVNKQYTLPESYGSGLKLSAYNAYLKMKEASGYPMSIVSGYRSFQKQQEVFAYWCMVDGEERAMTYSALPGQSEHQTGLAMDISSLEQSYGTTEEGKWLAENCWKYGFIIRYPKGKESITGYMYEPWHVRYLGTSTAKLVYDSGLTLEEFLGLV